MRRTLRHPPHAVTPRMEHHRSSDRVRSRLAPPTFTRIELQKFFDHADDQVDNAARSGRKGALAAYRDATLFKVIYGWGLRRTETAQLDIADWHRNPHAPEL